MMASGVGRSIGHEQMPGLSCSLEMVVLRQDVGCRQDSGLCGNYIRQLERKLYGPDYPQDLQPYPADLNH